MNLDPLAEKMVEWSPYNYSFNSPIFFTDPDGKAPQCCRGNDLPQPLHNFFSGLSQKFGSTIEKAGQAVGNFIADFHPGVSGLKTAQRVQSGEAGTGEVLLEVASNIPGGKFFKFGDEIADVASIIAKNGDEAGKIVLEKGAKFANDGEKSIAALLANEGKTVNVIAESTEQGVKSADFLIDGVKTELKTISNITSKDLSTALKRRLEGAGKQAGNVILDVTNQSGASQEVIESAIKRAFGSSEKLNSIRVIGDGFDITRTAN